MKGEIDIEFEQRNIEGVESIQGSSAVGEMRVMMTHCVAKVWEKFCNERQEVVVRSFRSFEYLFLLMTVQTLRSQLKDSTPPALWLHLRNGKSKEL